MISYSMSLYVVLYVYLHIVITEVFIVLSPLSKCVVHRDVVHCMNMYIYTDNMNMDDYLFSNHCDV